MTTDTATIPTPTTHCIHTDTPVTEDQCTECCSDGEKNRTVCAKMKCPSPWRLCLACVAHDEVDGGSIVVEGSHKCSWHTERSYNARKDPAENAQYEEQRPDIHRLHERIRGRKPKMTLVAVKNPVDESEILDDEPIDVGDQPTTQELVTAEEKAMVSVVEAVAPHTIDEASILSKLIQFEDDRVHVIPTHRIRRYEKQPRLEPDDELSDSIAIAGQIMPGLVVRVTNDPEYDFELDDGERRWLGCIKAGIPFSARIIQVHSEGHQHAVSAISNFGRKAHTEIEVALAIDRIRNELGLRVAVIAQLFSISAAYAHKHLQLLELHPDVYPLMSKKGKEVGSRLNLMSAALLTRLPKDQHLRVAQHIIAKKMRQAAAMRYIEQEANRLGIVLPTRKKKPAKLYRQVTNLMGSTLVKLGDIVDRQKEGLSKMFSGKSEHDRQAVLKEIDITLQRLRELRDALS